MSHGFVRIYLWRELRSIRGRLLATVVTLGVAVGVFAGVYSAINGLFEHRDLLYRASNIAAHEIRFVPEDAANVPDFSSIDGVGAWEPRLLLAGSYEKDEATRISALVIAVDPDRQSINRPQLIDGRVPAADDTRGALIDRNFAGHHDLGPGDEIMVKVGHDRIPLTVRGVAVFPEHLIDGAAPGFFMPSKGSLAVLQVSEQLVRARMGFRLLNSVIFASEVPGRDLDAWVVDKIEKDARRKLSIEASVPLSKQFGHLYLKMDLDAFKIFTPAICAILALACALVLAFVLRQWVTTHRSSLGVLLALGYSRRSLMIAWARPLAAVLVAGLLVGAGVGWLMMKGFGMEYAHAIGMPLPDLVLDLPVYLTAALAGAGMFVLVGIWSLWRIRQAQPVDAMRETDVLPPPSRADVPIKALLWRYPLRALLRSRRTAFGTMAVIALALAPATSFFVALHSFEQTIVNGLVSDRWHYTVDFISPAWDDELPALARSLGDARVEGFVRGMVRVDGRGLRESALVTGVSADSMRHPTIVAGRWLAPQDDDVVLLERRVVEKLGLKLGEPVRVSGVRDDFSPRLIGVVSGVMPSEAYGPVSSVRRWLDLDDQNTGAMISAPAWDDELPALARSLGDARVEGFARGMVRVDGRGLRESALVTGVSADSMRHPTIVAGRWLAPEDEDVVLLERRVVEKLGLALGEPVRVSGVRDDFSPRLIGVVSGVMPSEAYGPVSSVRRWLDLDDQNTGAMISAAGERTLTSASLFDIDWVARVMDKQRVIAEFVKHLKEIAGILHLATVFSLIVAVLALLVSVVFAFAARQSDFALLQILGFSRGAVSTMIRREVFLIGAVGVALSVPIAMLMAWGLNGLLGKAWLAVDTYVRLFDVLVVVAPALLVLPLAALPVIRAVRALDPVGVTRRRKFG
ncbi:ABC transporter permease [Denitromonas iodatirespirans]|uniref:FtsX-like permease family protein n=1 Tax=Denitromonas iodatirespirans TaxID=2795389 RepID=A0A944H8K2_DENI1|nr:ABC transporter permease [Denitromonas iodatirespirans]MBT0962408.1 FtsX-like permease family protein [Denitromonas iodatirespirans]